MEVADRQIENLTLALHIKPIYYPKWEKGSEWNFVGGRLLEPNRLEKRNPRAEKRLVCGVEWLTKRGNHNYVPGARNKTQIIKIHAQNNFSSIQLREGYNFRAPVDFTFAPLPAGGGGLLFLTHRYRPALLHFQKYINIHFRLSCF